MINRKSRGAQVKLEPWRKQRLKKDEHAKQKWNNEHGDMLKIK
jgi:hypothetical protein